MYAIPTPGRSVPIPGTRKLLPTSGQNIGPLTQYWQRRLRDGDITISEAAPVSAPAAAAAPAPTSAPAPAASAPAGTASEARSAA